MTDAISSILSQIRAHQTRVGAGAGDIAPGNAINPQGLQPDAIGRGTETSGFGQTLNNALESVSRTQRESGDLQKAFEMGDPRADLARGMGAMQQSTVAFRATVEVRNRLVQAYQDVMNMPI